jgi:hypothetical protein
MKKNDIVKFVGETGQCYSQKKPPFLENAIGKITGIVYKIMTNKKNETNVFTVEFLFEVNVEKRYVSSFTDFFKKEELQLATNEEKKCYSELEDIIKAKELAEKL